MHILQKQFKKSINIEVNGMVGVKRERLLIRLQQL